MLDRDLAELYGVSTKALNQAFKRNKERFPTSFAFTLNELECVSLRSQIVTLENRSPMGKGTHSKYAPTVYSEYGVAMLSAQYPSIDIHRMPHIHERFLIIDEQELYHIGASIKDLGKKWFAFSRMDSLVGDVLRQISKE